jgi:hypothetical protein
MATGTGIGSGSCGASTGSQRCSFDTCAAYDCALGSRTNRSGPRRNVRLSQPFGSAAVMGRLDHCGNCDRQAGLPARCQSPRIARRRGEEEEEEADTLFVGE